MLIHGNSYRISLKDESVHACISSYPYFGLRSYDLPPTIWGGDSNCQHVWVTQVNKRGAGGERDYGSYDEATGRGPAPVLPESAFCQLCNAWLGCFGLEPHIALHVQNAVLVSREVYRVLRPDGIFFLNYGDSYATSKNGRSAADTKRAGNDDRTFRDKPFSITELPAKNICGIPWRVALALQDDGWILRSDIIWSKPNPMPESVTDRPTKAHEYLFLLTKNSRYYYDAEAIREPHSEASIQRTRYEFNGMKQVRNHPGGRGNTGNKEQALHPNGRNCRSVWEIPTESFSGAHYATFPRKLVQRMILAATSARGVCPECGKPWRRIVKRGELVPDDPTYKPRGQNRGDGYVKNAMVPAGATQGHPNFHYEKLTTGWQPTCKCIQKRTPNFGMTGGELLELADEVAKELAPVGAIILDPFCGSGTVGAVCRELGRRFIGIDLSAKYLQENALPRSEKLTSEKALGQLPLFTHRPAEGE